MYVICLKILCQGVPKKREIYSWETLYSKRVLKSLYKFENAPSGYPKIGGGGPQRLLFFRINRLTIF
jgi:hypothetical protein